MNEKRSGKPFHLSIGVKSLEESANFFESVLGAQITHDDVYVNLSLYGNQITLKSNPNIATALPDFHFGINLSIDEFRLLEKKISKYHSEWIHSPLETADQGTEMERQKMYLRCPSGYLIELKGYE